MAKLSLQGFLSVCFFEFGMLRNWPGGEIPELPHPPLISMGLLCCPFSFGPHSSPKRLWILCVWLGILSFSLPSILPHLWVSPKQRSSLVRPCLTLASMTRLEDLTEPKADIGTAATIGRGICTLAPKPQVPRSPIKHSVPGQFTFY